MVENKNTITNSTERKILISNLRDLNINSKIELTAPIFNERLQIKKHYNSKVRAIKRLI